MYEIETKTGLETLPQPFKFIILLVIGLVLVFTYKHYEDAYEEIDGEWVRKPKFKDKIDDKTKSFDECEVYYLLALTDGLYECFNCGSGDFFLYRNEIVKIGYSCDGEGRYLRSFYEGVKVKYKTVFRGNSYDCEVEEIRQLGSYASLPENLARPIVSQQSRKAKRYRLLYPVRNTGLK